MMVLQGFIRHTTALGRANPPGCELKTFAFSSVAVGLDFVVA